MKKILFLLIFLSGCSFSYKKNKFIAPTIKIENKTIIWEKLKNANKYIIYINEENKDETLENRYSLSNLEFGEYQIKVKAVYSKGESLFSNVIVYDVKHILAEVKDVSIVDNVIRFTKEDEAVAFIYKNDELLISTTESSFFIEDLMNGDIIKIILKKEGYEDSIPIELIYDFLKCPSNLYIEYGILHFDFVDEAIKYLIYLNQELLVETTNNYYDLNIKIPGNYLIEIEAVSMTKTSDKAKINYKVVENIEALKSPQVKLNQGVLVWEHIPQAISYKISVNNSIYQDIGYVNSYNSELIKSGSNMIKIIAVATNPLYNSLEYVGEFVKLEVPNNVFLNDQNISWYSVNNASNYNVLVEYFDDSIEEFKSSYTSIYIENPEIKSVKVKAQSPGFLSSDYSNSFDKQNNDNTDFYSGIGSRKRPFIISNYIHLLNVNKYLNQNKYFELKNDIDLKDNEWVPFDYDFNGFFDGKGFKIYNFKIKNNQSNIYFIKSSSGNIMNLGLEYLINTNLSNINIGGLFLTNNGNIENVEVTLSIILEKPKIVNVSGISNSNLSLGSISKCNYRLTFDIKNYESLEELNLSGVCLNNEGFIHDVTGFLTYDNSFENLSGDINISLIAINNLGNIEKVLVDGIIDLNGKINKQLEIIYGGIAINNFNKIHNCKSVASVDISIVENNYLETIHINGISKTGKIYNSNNEGNISAVGSNIFVFGIGGDEINNSKFYGNIIGHSLKEEGYLAGIGCKPINVNNCNYEGNITSSGKNLYVGGITANNNKTGFCYFIGELNISGDNLYIGGITGVNNGLIEYSDSTIKLTTVSSKKVNAGGICGVNYGHIKDVNSICNMNIKSEEANLGGLVGINNKENNIIEKSYSSVNIKVDGIICNVGGLVGNNLNGVIRTVYAIGVLLAPSKTLYSKTGGLIGYSETSAIVKNSYAIVNIESSFYSGGLIGHNKGNIINSYSIGRVESNAYAGGLVGFNEGIICDSFYDIEKSNQNDKDKGIGLNSTQMRTPNIFSTWPKFISIEDLKNNVDNVWVLFEGKIPQLYFQ